MMMTNTPALITTTSILLSIILMTIVVVSSLSSSSVSALSIAPTFDFHLDQQPPQTRWNGVIQKLLDLHPWENSFGPLFDHYQDKLYSNLSNNTRTTLENIVKTRFSENYQELQGLAQQFAAVGHPEVTLNWLCFWVWFHELDHADSWGEEQKNGNYDEYAAKKFMRINTAKDKHRDCTGVLAAPANRALPIIHGRNLDQSVHPARNLTLQIRFYYKQNLVFTATDFYWMSSGFVTAQMNGGITLEENWRYNHPTLTFQQIMTRIENQQTIPQVLMFRILLTKRAFAMPPSNIIQFDEALSFFNNSQFASPFYGIMSGFSQQNNSRSGVIMSISFDKQNNNFAIMNDQTISIDENDDESVVNSNNSINNLWYMVQTNYDRWLPDPPNDARRTVAENTLKMLQREEGATKLGVWQTISTYDVHNPDTFYSVLMTMNETSRGYIRRGMIPAKN